MSWTLGVTTGGCVDRPILDVLEAVEESGFRVVEIGTPPRHFDLWSDSQIAAVTARLDRGGMRAVAIHAPFGGVLDLSDPDPRHRDVTFESIVQSGKVLRALGGSIVVVHPTDTPRHGQDVDKRLETCIRELTRLVLVLAAMDLKLAVESPLPHLIGGDPAEFTRILDRLDDRVGVCIDTGHVTLGGHWSAFLAFAGERLVHVHADDHRGSFDDHLPPGEGILDWRVIAEGLRRSGYEGNVVLELACAEGPLSEYFSRARSSAEALLGCTP